MTLIKAGPGTKVRAKSDSEQSSYDGNYFFRAGDEGVVVESFKALLEGGRVPGRFVKWDQENPIDNGVWWIEESDLEVIE